MDEALSEQADYICDKLGGAVLDRQVVYHELTLRVQRETIAASLKLLRDDPQCQFSCLIDIAGVDYPERANRFDVVYHLLSPRQNARIRLKLETDPSAALAEAERVLVDRTPGIAFGLRGAALCRLDRRAEGISDLKRSLELHPFGRLDERRRLLGGMVENLLKPDDFGVDGL